MKQLFSKIKNKCRWLVNKYLRSMRWYQAYWGGVLKFWELRTFNIEVINTGSNSGLHAFDYSNLPIKGMNWALGPQSIQHDYNILKNYFSYLKEGAYVIISLCPFSSLVSTYTKEQNKKYYTFLHPATIQNFEEQERTEALECRENLLKKKPLLVVKNTIKEILRNIVPHKPCIVDMEESARNFMKAWTMQFSIEDINAPLSDEHKRQQEQRIADLSTMIQFCLDRNLRPVIVIPPIHSALGKKLTPQCRENYLYSFIRQANIKNIPFYDYIDFFGISTDNYFRNAFFLNKKGAQIFTKRVLTDIGLI